MTTANRFRLGGIALLVLVWLCTVASAQAQTVTVDSFDVTEGNAATTNATFTLTLDSPQAAALQVDYQVEPGTAVPQADYTLPPVSSVTFAPGDTTETVDVPVIGDTEDEQSETFFLTIIGLGDNSGQATILDEDATLSIGDVEVTEGNAGITIAAFTVTASSADSRDITVAYSTADGTGTAPLDYSAASGTLTFLEGGALTQTIAVSVVGDTAEEAAETFSVNLTGVPTANASLARAQGTGRIQNDDLDPSTPGILDEGDLGDDPTVQTRALRGLTFVPSKRRVKKNALLRFSGLLRVTRGPAGCRSRQKIAIQRRKASGGRFQTFEVAVTTRSGSFQASTRPLRTYIYRARVSQTARCMGARSKVAKVVVRKRSRGSRARR